MFKSFVLSDAGSVRGNNEDYHLVVPELGLCIVADGMGGTRGGEHASRLAAETVAEIVRGSERRDMDTLVHAFEEAHRSVTSAAGEDPRFRGMGTTLVALLEAGREVLLASVGDSRAYAFEDSRLRQITADQSWVQEVGRRIGLDEASLRSHPMRHILTMAIGANTLLKTHSYTLHPKPGTQILLCTDGLHGVVDDETIAQTLNSEQSLEAKCHYLVEAAIRAGGPDNITAALLQVL